MSTRREIAGFKIRRTTTANVVRFLNRRLRRRRQTVVFFANANFITRCRHLGQTISKSKDLIVLNDGLALDFAAFLRYGVPFPDNLNGSDFTLSLLSQLDQEARVYLFGGRPSVVEAAAKAFDDFSHVQVVGYADGYSTRDAESTIVEHIAQAAPDILLVALGNPLQEEWVLRNRNAVEVPLILAVGALFDFVSGYKPRAPKVLRLMRLEWAFRLALEPRRLVGRYTIGIVRFFAAVILDRGEGQR